jgi:hypothetical protein
MRRVRMPPPEAVPPPEPQLPEAVIAAYRVQRDRFREALHRRDDVAAEQALSAFATAAIRAGFTKRTARAAVQVVGEEVARLASPYRRDRRPVLAAWTRRFDDVYDALLATGDLTA